MIIHIVLSRDAQHYLGLKSRDLPKASEISKDGHFYSVWRMDLWPNELAGLPEYTDFAPLILTNAATRFSLLRVDSVMGIESFKGNVSSYLQWPLHLGSFPTEQYGRMEIRFYGGAHRSLATSMKDMRERAGQLMENETYSLEDLEGLLNDEPLQFNDYETPRRRMGRMVREDPPEFPPSDDEDMNRVVRASETLKKGESLLTSRTQNSLEFTVRQGQFLSFIHHYRLVNGQAPAESDMVRFFRITAPSVHSMVMTLDSRGLIERTPGKARSIRILVPLDRLPTLEEARR